MTLTVRSAGSPALAASRSAVTWSLSAKPDSVVATGTGAIAALPSSDGVTGIGGPGVPVAATIRSRADSTAVRSAGVNAPPSLRVTTRITGADSPPGNSLSSAATLADSALGGNDTGDFSAASPWPIAPINPPPMTATISASSQECRLLTRSPMRAHSGRLPSDPRCITPT